MEKLLKRDGPEEAPTGPGVRAGKWQVRKRAADKEEKGGGFESGKVSWAICKAM